MDDSSVGGLCIAATLAFEFNSSRKLLQRETRQSGLSADGY